jgi:hypothetical protein
MRDVLTVFAVIISMTGVVISLTREELRCWAGLASTACQSSRPETAPSPNFNSPLPASREAKRVQSPSQAPSDSVLPATEGATTAPKLTRNEPAPASQDTPTGSQPMEVAPPASGVSQAANQTPNSPPPSPSEQSQGSQPIEVIPPPSEAANQVSQPLEVIPPPEP